MIGREDTIETERRVDSRMIQEKDFWCTWILRVHLHGQGAAYRHIAPVADVRAALGARQSTCQKLDVIAHLRHSGLGKVQNGLRISWTLLSSAAQHHGTPDNTHILVVGDENHGVMVDNQTTNW